MKSNRAEVKSKRAEVKSNRAEVKSNRAKTDYLSAIKIFLYIFRIIIYGINTFFHGLRLRFPDFNFRSLRPDGIHCLCLWLCGASGRGMLPARRPVHLQQCLAERHIIICMAYLLCAGSGRQYDEQ